ncbi:hypothetical protein AGLY_002365 [Aphis glycines]|uniref:Reverse transcriptase domain-containing protein n=1 Tax=Aphis glycines TaxID=307491 RepID=A0A6G0U381_APHGL|nr:hypothetical protein AGLY_002365 [Aphis glycines]
MTDQNISDNSITIVQVNMARTATANEDLLLYAQKERIDVALLQEPYVRYGRLVGLETSPIRIILSPGVQQKGGRNILHGAAIVIFNPTITALARNDLTCDNFAVATISIGTGKDINLISAYFKYRTPTAELVGTLRRITRSCGPNTLIGADINAFSKGQWFSKTTDARGQLVEDYIAEEQLSVLNKRNRLYTFSGPRGENNIDITLATKDISSHIKDWDILDGEITSDHRLITYKIGGGDRISIKLTKKRYATRCADWDKFMTELTLQLHHAGTDIYYADLEDRTELLMQAIKKAADKSIPKRKITTKKETPWKSWRSFAGDIREDIWGRCFRWIKKGSASHEAPSVLKKPNGEYTKTLRETLQYLLDTFIPSNPNEAGHIQEPRKELHEYQETSMVEVKNAIWRMSTRKAPGGDGIDAKILRKAWNVIAHPVTELFNDLLRSATLESNQTKLSTMLTRGCPQGSGFGPSLWNIVVNEVLKKNNGDHTHRVAYADDIVVLTAGSTRTDIIRKTEENLNDLIEWSKRYGLSFSSSKSAGMPLKGGLAPGHHIEFGGIKIRIEDNVKYLGIMIDKDMKFKTHISNIAQKKTEDFSRLRSMVGSEWGANFNTALLLYKAVFIPRITYGASIWMENWGKVETAKINRTQRIPLLAVTGAYRTAPTEGLQGVAGLLPLDLQILWEGIRQEARQGEITSGTQEELQQDLINIWQDRWNKSTKARWTYKMIPDIKTRMSTLLELDHYVVQYITGHGDFAAKLHSLGLRETPSCNCGLEDEDPEHAIFNCSNTIEERNNLTRKVTEAGFNWPCDISTFVKTRALFEAFKKFAKETLKAKKQEDMGA